MLLKKSDFPFNPLSLSWNSRVVKQKEVGERKEKEWPYPPISLLVKCEFVRQKKLWIEGKNKNNLCMGNGNPLQYSCLENPMDGGAWWATVHGSKELDTTERLSLTTLTHGWVSCQNFTCIISLGLQVTDIVSQGSDQTEVTCWYFLDSRSALSSLLCFYHSPVSWTWPSSTVFC